jgi:choline dehydrogenase-like flavoprotein
MALPKVDVVIIGLGAAGGVMAKELSTAGMKVHFQLVKHHFGHK